MAFILIIASLVLFLWIVSLCKVLLLPRIPFAKHFTNNNGNASSFFLSLQFFFLFPSFFQAEHFGREMPCWLLLILMTNPCKFPTTVFSFLMLNSYDLDPLPKRCVSSRLRGSLCLILFSLFCL